MRTPSRALVSVLACALLGAGGVRAEEEYGPRPHVVVRGIYGGEPTTLMEEGRTLPASGVDAVWIGERGITADRVVRLRAQGAKVFAEFNTLHHASYLKEHPDAAPIGPDGKTAPAPHGWQGICPTHAAYRAWRMEAFRELLSKQDVDGVWLDYHHAHASWERADPVLPDTCFCPSCLAAFENATGIVATDAPVVEVSRRLLGEHADAWTTWRCGVFTDWVREFRAILDEVRPSALLGTFHCPWTEEERDGALKTKLAIDLEAQSRYLDVFSPMPYHARFGHADDPAWISRQTAWLGEHLGVKGEPGERLYIWPIVQLSDWGEAVPVEQVAAVLDHGTRAPATGVMAFAWGKLRQSPAKVEAMARFYRAIGIEQPAQGVEVGSHRVAVRLVPSKRRFLVGEPVWLRFEVKNLGETALTFQTSLIVTAMGRSTAFHVEVRHREAEEPLPIPDTGPAHGMLTRTEIPAGETWTKSLFLPFWAEIRRPGTYVVTCRKTLIVARVPPDRTKQDPSVDTTTSIVLEALPSDPEAMGAVIEGIGRAVFAGSDPEARAQALRSLHHVHDVRTIPWWRSAIESGDAGLMVEAPRGLGAYDADAAVDALAVAARTQARDIANARDAEHAALAARAVRWSVAQALGTRTDEATLPILRRLAEDSDERVRAAAEASLRRRGG